MEEDLPLFRNLLFKKVQAFPMVTKEDVLIKIPGHLLLIGRYKERRQTRRSFGISQLNAGSSGSHLRKTEKPRPRHPRITLARSPCNTKS